MGRLLARDDRARTMARYLAVLFGGGATLGLLGLLAPHAPGANEDAMRVLLLSAYPIVALLLAVGHRLPLAAFHVLLASGTAIVTMGIHLAGDAPSAAQSSMFYIWVGVYAFTFFSITAACAHVVLLAGAYGAVVVFAGEREDIAPWLLAVGTVVVTGFVVGRLARDNMALAGTDPLTGLPNRRTFDREVRTELVRAAPGGGARLCALVVDLDHFKHVNDTLGHSAGDELLVACAARLRECVRERDLAARLGGDEFAVLMEVRDESVAEHVVNRIIEAFRVPVALRGHQIVVGASIGLAFAGGVTTVDELIRNADLAMYCAKAAGRGRYEVYDGSMHERALERLQLEQEFRAALAADEISVDYQPIVAIDSGAIRGFEALARWHHPTRGAVPPALFIPIAERTGLIVALGQRVFELACRMAARVHEIDPTLDFTVNLSPIQLVGDGVVEAFAAELRSSGVPPTRMVLEITENALMRDVDETRRHLMALKALGVRIAVDDFGVGHSSLSHLRNFPVDVLKIDKSFVDGLPASGRELALAIVQLGAMLGLDVVAEGIESRAQLETLEALGCPHAQGYLLARPMPASRVIPTVVGERDRRDGRALPSVRIRT